MTQSAALFLSHPLAAHAPGLPAPASATAVRRPWLRGATAAANAAAAAQPALPGGGDRDLDQLLMASADGDSQAFERLYRLSSAALYAVVRRTTWQRCEAEEVLQEAYVKIWRYAATFDPRQALAMTWMARIARNHAIDHLRRGSSRVSRECVLDADTAEGESGVGHAEQLADPAPQPHQVLEQQQTTRRIDNLLSRLSFSQRQVLMLAFREGLSQAEIAEQLGAPLGTVKSWMRRGLQSLKEQLAGDSLGAAEV